MTIQQLIKELDNFKIKNSSSFDYDKDYINHLKKIENVISSFDENKVHSFCKLIEENLRKKDFENLDYTIGILSSIYDFKEKDERIISKKLIGAIEIIVEEYKSETGESIFSNLYKIFDTYFHNPGLIDELIPEEQKDLIRQINKIASIKYKEGSNFELIHRKIIGCLFYFKPSKKLEELKMKYKFHFDIQIRNEASKLK